MKAIIPAVGALLLAACASRYEPPQDTATTVPLVFINRGPAAVTYIRPTPQACSTTSDAGFVGAIGRANVAVSETLQRPTRVRHSVPITVSMGWWADSQPVRECGEKLTFTPKAGRDYEVEFISSPEMLTGSRAPAACSVEVRERSQAGGPFTRLGDEVVRTRERLCLR
jgi:hypothetical protein